MTAMPPLSPLLRQLHQLTVGGSCAQTTDRELLNDFAARRDEAAFTALVGRHGPMVLNVCRRVLNNEHDAEDAFQATFLVLARNSASIRQPNSLGSWLHGVAYRTAMKVKRGEGRRRNHEARLQKMVPIPRTNPGWDEVQAVLDEEIECLPPAFREAFVRCVLEGKSGVEVAADLGCREGTVRSRVNRARRQLQHRLARRGIKLSTLLAGLAIAQGARASLPAALAQTAIRSGLLMAAGESVAEVIPSHVAALAAGVTRTVNTYTVKVVPALLLIVGLVAGAGLIARQTTAAREAVQSQPPEIGNKPPQPARASEQAKPSSNEKPDAIDVQGRVLDIDGKPIPQARVYVFPHKPETETSPPVRATTDPEGRFRLSIKKTEVDHNETLLVSAKEYGPDWIKLGKTDLEKEITLRLVKDVPITGRVLDLEGRPLDGARVRVLSVWKTPDEDLTPLVKDLQQNPADRREGGSVWIDHQDRMSMVTELPEGPNSTTTGADGRFRLSGIGRERVLYLRIEGDAIEHTFLKVLTRAKLNGLPDHAHGAVFEHVAGPTKPIRGVVKDRQTGKPLAGVTIVGQPVLETGTGEGAFTRSDQQGRFTLVGMPKAGSYHLTASRVPYITGRSAVDDSPGLEPIRANFELERALGLRVRVIDRSTRRPVRAYVRYGIRRDNPHVDDYPSWPRNVVGWGVNDEAGWITTTVLPGPAFIAVQATEGEFTRARLEGKDGDERFAGDLITGQPLLLDTFHAVVPIHPDEKKPGSLTVTIALDPGQSTSGQVVGPDGRPLEGATAAGLKAVKKVNDHTSDKLSDSTFTALGLEPDHPRTVLFFHPAKRLGRAVILRGDEAGPVTVKLEPLGAITGRLVDANDKPMADTQVWLQPARTIEATLPGELVVYNLGTLIQNLRIPPVKTDDQGRFRMEGLVPGMKYDLLTGRSQTLKRELSVPAGKEVDLGEISR